MARRGVGPLDSRRCRDPWRVPNWSLKHKAYAARGAPLTKVPSSLGGISFGRLSPLPEGSGFRVSLAKNFTAVRFV
jgi:hypothetical protein